MSNNQRETGEEVLNLQFAYKTRGEVNKQREAKAAQNENEKLSD